MKPRFSNKPTNALTLVEVLVIIAVLAVLWALMMPAMDKRPRRIPRLVCVNNLNQIGIAFRLWEGDNNGKYPMAVSATNGGAMELVATGNIAACFQAMSNELYMSKILLCPADTHRALATNFSTLNNSNISYFVGLDVTNHTNPQMVLDGDDNLTVGGMRIQPGILNLWTNAVVGWTKERHHGEGNIGLADGSVQRLTTNGLQQALQQAGVATNRLAVP